MNKTNLASYGTPPIVRFDILKPVFSLPVEPLTTFTKSFWQASPVKKLEAQMVARLRDMSRLGTTQSWTIFPQDIVAHDTVRMWEIDNPHSRFRPTTRKGCIWNMPKNTIKIYQTCSWIQTCRTGKESWNSHTSCVIYRLFLYKPTVLVCFSGRDTHISGYAGDCYTTSFLELHVQNVQIISNISVEKILTSFPTRW